MFTEEVVNGITKWTFPYGYLEWVIDDTGVAILCFLHVDDGYRRRGLGKHMMKVWTEHLILRRVFNIELDNVLEPENKFYEDLGFKYKQRFDNTMLGKTIRVFYKSQYSD